MFSFTMFFWIALFSLSFSQIKGSPEQGKVVACHYDLEAYYNSGYGRFTLEDLDVTNCTHLLYNYLNVDPFRKAITSSDESLDYEANEGQGYFYKLIAIKEKHPNLKILPVIGGEREEETVAIGTVVDSSSGRKIFARNAMFYLVENNFDGLVLFWYSPSTRKDKNNMAVLIKELNNIFKEHDLELMVLMNVVQLEFYPINAIKDHVDFIFPNALDYHTNEETYTAPSSPLFSFSGYHSVASSIQNVLDQGVDPAKILTSLSFYGAQYVTKARSKGIFGKEVVNNNFLYGPYTQAYDWMQYNEICLREQNWTRHWDDGSKTPLVTKGNLVISYDDAESLREKIKYGQKLKLGGVQIWGIAYDDFRGDCGQGKYPLMSAVTDHLHENSELTEAPVTTTTVPGTANGHSSQAPITGIEKTEDSDEGTNVNTNNFVIYCPRTQNIEVGPESNDICHFTSYEVQISSTLVSKEEAAAIRRLVRLRRQSPDLRVILAIPGKSFLAKGLRSDAVLNALRTLALDGVDFIMDQLDSNDEEKLLSLITDLKPSFSQHDYTLILTITSSVKSMYKLRRLHNLVEMASFLNLAHFLTEKVSNFPIAAPLHSEGFQNLVFTVNYALSRKVDPQKLILGLPTFGLEESKDGKVIQITHTKVCELKKNDKYIENWNNSTSTPYLEVNGRTAVTFEDDNSFMEKLEFVKTRHLRGVSIYWLDTDDYEETCSSLRFPLLNLVNLLL